MARDPKTPSVPRYPVLRQRWQAPLSGPPLSLLRVHGFDAPHIGPVHAYDHAYPDGRDSHWCTVRDTHTGRSADYIWTFKHGIGRWTLGSD